MAKLYALTKFIKAHPLYRSHRDEIHFIFFRLGLEKKLTFENLYEEIQKSFSKIDQDLSESAEILQNEARIIEKLQQQNVHFVCAGESLYPRSFYLMEDPPLLFSFRGHPVWLKRPCLSIVGSREPGFETLQWMENEVAAFLQSSDVGIISGGARGVDQKAHTLALRVGRPTCVVLPSGLGRIYPANLNTWVDSIVDGGGCLVSEYDYEMPMQKYLFPHRNRLIAALGLASVIVEARNRSGTMITAENACQMGRPVWVLPGHPQNPLFSGSLQLLMEGATLVRHAADLQALFTAEALAFNTLLAGIGGFGSFASTGSVSIIGKSFL